MAQDTPGPDLIHPGEEGRTFTPTTSRQSDNGVTISA